MSLFLLFLFLNSSLSSNNQDEMHCSWSCLLAPFLEDMGQVFSHPGWIQRLIRNSFALKHKSLKVIEWWFINEGFISGINPLNALLNCNKSVNKEIVHINIWESTLYRMSTTICRIFWTMFLIVSISPLIFLLSSLMAVRTDSLSGAETLCKSEKPVGS